MSKLKLYSYFRSSASYRVRIALHLKEIDFEYIPVHLLNEGGEQHQPPYVQNSPMAQVPCLEHDGRFLSQSLAIIEYLDRMWPSPPLFPESPWEKAEVISLCEIVNSGIQPLQNLSVNQQLKSQFDASAEEIGRWNQKWISKGLKALETTLSKTSQNFSYGDEITALDLFIIPQLFSSLRFGVDIENFPILSKIQKKCMSHSAFQKAAPESQSDSPK